MKNNCGFTIIEWLIYFFILISVFVCVFHFITRIQLNLINISNKSGIVSQISVAHDAIEKDLSVSPCDLEMWNEITEERIAYKMNNLKIIWDFSKKNLYRIEEKIDLQQKKRVAQKKSVVARNISQVTFIPHYTEDTSANKKRMLHRMDCTIEHEAYTSKRTTVIKNRIF